MWIRKFVIALVLSGGLSWPMSLQAEKDAVAVIIDRSVYQQVEQEFETYRKDVERRFPVELVVSKEREWEDADPLEIRRELQRMHRENGIVGAVLVGQIPYTFWERKVDSYFTGINTLYYQELDGEFIDRDSDGRFDEIEWGPNEGPELWVFWMRPPKKDNIRYLRLFLRKCHRYYSGRIRAPYRAMLYARYPSLGNSPMKRFIAGRDCPHSCIYCFNHLYHRMY